MQKNHIQLLPHGRSLVPAAMALFFGKVLSTNSDKIENGEKK